MDRNLSILTGCLKSSDNFEPTKMLKYQRKYFYRIGSWFCPTADVSSFSVVKEKSKDQKRGKAGKMKKVRVKYKDQVGLFTDSNPGSCQGCGDGGIGVAYGRCGHGFDSQ